MFTLATLQIMRKNQSDTVSGYTVRFGRKGCGLKEIYSKLNVPNLYEVTSTLQFHLNASKAPLI